MRRGKSGLKRYLLDRLHRVKEVFRKEICERDQFKAKYIETIVEEPGTEEPVPAPMPAPEPEINEVL